MKKTITLIFTFLQIGISPTDAQTAGKPVIDMHQHARFKVWLDESGEPYPRICFPQPCKSEPSLAKKDTDVLRLTLATMEKYNVVLAVVSDEILDEVYQWKSSAPEKFLAGAGFFSIEAADSVKIERDIKAGKIQIIGEIGVQYDGMTPNDDALETYYTMAEKYDLPVLIHCEGIGGGDHRFDLSAGNPLMLQKVLNEHPKLRIYVENAGWPFLEEMTSLMYRYPNVYADLSTITWIIPEQTFYTYLKGLINNGLGERLMYGSDQMVWPEGIEIGIQRIQNADFLTELQKRDIFYNNAARFLKLTDFQILEHHKN